MPFVLQWHLIIMNKFDHDDICKMSVYKMGDPDYKAELKKVSLGVDTFNTF